MATPFPTLSTVLDDWRWPAPPFTWSHEAPLDGPQPCRIETLQGSTVEGELLNVDPTAGVVELRLGPGGGTLAVPFERFCRLTLTQPLRAIGRRTGDLPEHVPVAAHARRYTLHRYGGVPLEGETVGSMRSAEMLLLWSPVDRDRSVLRVLVPRSAYDRAEFGDTAEDVAARRWIATPEQLLRALVERKPVLAMGAALLELGFITQEQLDTALAESDEGRPLGERLVKSGVLSRSNLHTALAYKVGMPLVNLARFPLKPETVQKLPRKLAIASRALPLLEDAGRLIVAVDRPSRIEKLRHARFYADYRQVVPVLAAKLHILNALTRLAQADVWAEQVLGLPEYFATTN